MNENATVKEYEFINPDNNEVDYLLDIVKKDCKKYFHSFEYRCHYDIKYTIKTNINEFFFPFSLGYMEFRFEYYGLHVKIENAKHIGYTVNHLLKLPIIIYSSLSNINIHYYI